MAKAKLKTAPNDRSVEAFLEGIEDEKRRQDCFTLLELMKEVTGVEPRMWGDSIVGFGSYHIVTKAGVKVTGS